MKGRIVIIFNKIINLLFLGFRLRFALIFHFIKEFLISIHIHRLRQFISASQSTTNQFRHSELSFMK